MEPAEWKARTADMIVNLVAAEEEAERNEVRDRLLEVETERLYPALVVLGAEMYLEFTTAMEAKPENNVVFNLLFGPFEERNLFGGLVTGSTEEDAKRMLWQAAKPTGGVVILHPFVERGSVDPSAVVLAGCYNNLRTMYEKLPCLTTMQAAQVSPWQPTGWLKWMRARLHSIAERVPEKLNAVD
jgi:hypothetical protein